MRIVILAFVAIAFGTPTYSFAAPMTFQIDSDLSRLSFAGNFRNPSGQLIPLLEQLPGSLSVPLAGSFTANLGDGTIEIYIEAHSVTPTDRLILPAPNFGGLIPTIGDIGGMLVDPTQGYTAYTAIRDISLTAYTGPRVVSDTGDFNVTTSVISLVRDHETQLLMSFEPGISYSFMARNPFAATNASTQQGSIVRDHEEVIITIPIHFKYSFNTGAQGLASYDTALDGIIVAKATIPEVTSLLQLFALLLAIPLARICFQRSALTTSDMRFVR